MGHINVDVENVEMDYEKRERKLTAKALVNNIEKLQRERKTSVNKIKAHIIKKGNASRVQTHNLIQLCEKAIISHEMLIPLLQEDELNKQKEWFASILEYSESFQRDIKLWLKEPQEDFAKITAAVLDIPTTDDIQDDVQPSDSVSNVEIGRRANPSQNSALGKSLQLLLLRLHALKQRL